MSKPKNTVECRYCGKDFTKSGIINHEKACTENPDNVVEEIEEVEVEIKEVKEEVEEKLYEIKLKEKVDCYIGDRYHRYGRGEVVEVTLNVKEVLGRVGVLDFI